MARLEWKRRGAWGVVILLSGCGLHHLRRTEAYTCRGAEPARPRGPIVPPIPESTSPVGRLQVKALDPVPDTADAGVCEIDNEECLFRAQRLARSALAPHAKRRLQVVAEAVPLHLFAARLSEALGVPIVTSPHVADLRISVAAPAVTVQDLRAALTYAYPLSFDESGHRSDRSAVAVLSLNTSFATRKTEWLAKELAVQLLTLRSDTPVRQAASMLCDQVLTARGSLSVVGRTLVVRDLPENFGKVRQAVIAVEEVSDEGD